MKGTETVLKYLVRDEPMFDIALLALDRLLKNNSECRTQDPPNDKKLILLYRSITREKDTEQNFDIAVTARVLLVFSELYPGWFDHQSGDGGKDVTDILWTVGCTQYCLVRRSALLKSTVT